MTQVNKLCVVAGAGPGMGLAIARRFALEGFDLALLARNASALDAAVQALSRTGVRAISVAVDLASPDDVSRAFAVIRDTLGDPSVMVYNAARWQTVPAMTIDPGTFTADLSLSITGALACAQQVVPAMREASVGSLIFTGGGLALYPQYGAGMASLTAGKAGLRAMVYALNGELQPDGIRVATVTIAGTVAPGTAFDPDLIANTFWSLHADPSGPVEIVFDGKAADSPPTSM